MRTLVSALLGGAFVLALLAGTAAAGPLPDADVLSTLPQITTDELARERGGTLIYIRGDEQDNLATFNSPNNGQIGGNVSSGAISGNTVSNISGISSVMYNTGSNVVFNNATQVNINLK